MRGNLLNKIGIDGAIALTVLTRIIQAGGGLIAIVFIAKYLSANEQGYYYTFASILAIQVFFELGLSGILTQYAAHEFAYLSWKDGWVLSGDGYYKSRLSSLLRFCIKWFGIISVCLFFLLLVVGFYFFKNNNNGITVDWQRPWVILCITTSLNLFIDPVLAFFDGLGLVKDMAKLRLIQKGTNIIFLFIFFLLGFKLYAAGLASLCSIAINYIQIILSDKTKILKNIWLEKNSFVINYYEEIFPFQWRIAVSWISGYFIFQLFNPVLFATSGPVIAGQMGMTLTALNGVLSLTLSWINTKVPLFSNLIAKSDYSTLDAVFNKTLKQSCSVCILILLFMVSVIIFLQDKNMALGHRFLNSLPLILLSISTFVNQLIFSLATYLRCHKREPLLLQSVVLGITSGICTIVFGKLYGVVGITISYTFLMIFVGLTWAFHIFNKKKQLWH